MANTSIKKLREQFEKLYHRKTKYGELIYTYVDFNESPPESLLALEKQIRKEVIKISYQLESIFEKEA